MAELDEGALVVRLSEGASVAFDTNVLHKAHTVFEVADAVKKANATLGAAGKPTIHVVIPALCWAELVLHQRHKFSGRYDETQLKDALIAGAMTVYDFTESDASSVAAYIAYAYPSKELWQNAKLDAMLACLAVTNAPGKKVPATVDWYIAGHAMARGWILVTEDKGVEFNGPLVRTTLKALEAALDTLGATPP